MATRDAVIVATARTPIGRAYRGAFNNTPSPMLAAHAIRAAIARAGVDPAEVDDSIFGCSLPQGVQQAIGRTAALHAGLPVTVSGMTIDRQCSSGLMTIATAAKQVVIDRMDVVACWRRRVDFAGADTGGAHGGALAGRDASRRVHADAGHRREVAKRYGIGREAQDAYSLQSQQRTAAAQAAGRFDAEIIPVTAACS